MARAKNTKPRRSLEHKVSAERQRRQARTAKANLDKSVPVEIRNGILLAARSSLDSLRRGEGVSAHWMWVNDALVMGATLDRQVYGNEHALAFAQAAEGHEAVAVRHKERGASLVYTGPELAAVVHALEIHEAQLEQATWREMRAAMDEVERQRQAANNSPDTGAMS